MTIVIGAMVMIFSFIFGIVIGIITTPIMLSVAPNANPHKNHLARRSRK